MKEVWKEVKHIPYHYVSNMGRIKTIDRVVERIKNGKKSTLSIKGKIKSLTFDKKKGYYNISYSIKNKHYTDAVHRIVARTFIDEKYLEKGLVVDHIDRDRQNNNLENLRVVSQSDNCLNTSRNRSSYDDRSIYRNKSGIGKYLNTFVVSKSYSFKTIEQARAYRDAVEKFTDNWRATN